MRKGKREKEGFGGRGKKRGQLELNSFCMHDMHNTCECTHDKVVCTYYVVCIYIYNIMLIHESLYAFWLNVL